MTLAFEFSSTQAERRYASFMFLFQRRPRLR